MKKIYLFCAAGMSTSLLVTKMQQVATTHNLPVEISAHPYGQAEDMVKKDRPDCVLLGPQVKYMFAELKGKFEPMGIPVDVIDSVDYGTMNGEKVLRHAVALIKANAAK